MQATSLMPSLLFTCSIGQWSGKEICSESFLLSIPDMPVLSSQSTCGQNGSLKSFSLEICRLSRAVVDGKDFRGIPTRSIVVPHILPLKARKKWELLEVTLVGPLLPLPCCQWVG